MRAPSTDHRKHFAPVVLMSVGLFVFPGQEFVEGHFPMRQSHHGTLHARIVNQPVQQRRVLRPGPKINDSALADDVNAWPTDPDPVE